MIVKYLTFGISITFISWIVGMIINAFLIKTTFYDKNLTSLNFIKSKKLNKRIGIGIVKWIVKNTFFKFFNPNLKMKRKIELSELDQLRKEMTLAEINHLIAFGFVAIFAIVAVVKSNYMSALIMMLVNILMNLYPSLLQQENKRRIDKLKLVFNRINPSFKQQA
ncbi:glycosyl-4,4'-diaponeurosporenoate acyltransferase CrtO family protein [Pedobacter paludis]|uniref:glycosyl-4,4'-diaponeurosporenoate acyltransferase CrtO family protein n=1 Tax=Pedobacter paludis TaxID=2203212 RepID=UPI00142D93B3|nr:hypothetical protein [Pedobacter paludis]